MTNTVTKKTLSEFYKLFEQEQDSTKNIKPAFKHKYGICISTSDFYAKYASLLLLSIIHNATQENQYDILILTTDMSIENQRIIKGLTDADNIRIRIFNIQKQIENYKFYTWAHFTPNTYYRLSIPQLFKNYDKILYLDSDTIVNTDIATIFDTDFEDNYIAACKDTHVMSYCNGLSMEQLQYNTNTLKLKNPKAYFQMGVSLFNIKKFNKEFSDKNLLDIASKVQYRWLDQDILNVTFHGKIKELPIKWNVMIMTKPPYIDEYFLPTNYRKKYYEARTNPNIIHYCGGVYYRYPFVPDMGKYFWKYTLMSPFFEEIMTQMIALKLPKNDLQNKELDCLRKEFQNMHFPNINNRFTANEYNTKLLYVLAHTRQFKLKKAWFGFKKAFAFGKRHEKYQAKYDNIKQLLKDARKFKKQLMKV